ncbi:MAG: flagellar hook-basal body complex protein FliE [Neomegalonema sp.]|nr:flagellar hook-basal body complex protein FliE [Neomegalonema sp.]
MDLGSKTAHKLYGQAIAAAKPASSELRPATEQAPRKDFAETLADVAQDTVDTIVRGEQTAMQGLAGKADAHSVVEALAATELALETAVTVRDKVVEAYQEILRMPV